MKIKWKNKVVLIRKLDKLINQIKLILINLILGKATRLVVIIKVKHHQRKVSSALKMKL